MNYFIIPQIEFSAMPAILTRKKFTEEEDTAIIQFVNSYGPKNWDQLAFLLPGRTGRQCRDRYFNYLIPGYFNGEWSKEEDNLLKEKFNEMGRQWSRMKPFFPGRSSISIKNRWEYFLCKFDQNCNSEDELKNEKEKINKCNNNVNVECDKQKFSIQQKVMIPEIIHKALFGVDISTQTDESYLLSHMKTDVK